MAKIIETCESCKKEIVTEVPAEKLEQYKRQGLFQNKLCLECWDRFSNREDTW